MGEIETDIIRLVARLERNYKRVYPFMLQPWLEYYRAEQTLRRDMARLARQGLLVRVGGAGARRGYLAPSGSRARAYWRDSIGGSRSRVAWSRSA